MMYYITCLGTHLSILYIIEKRLYCLNNYKMYSEIIM